jgi:hypothetical protein
MENEGSEKLACSMRKFFLRIGNPRRQGGDYGFEMSPGCPFGALVAERISNMEGNIRELKGRINGLIFLLVAVVFAEVIIRLVG